MCHFVAKSCQNRTRFDKVIAKIKRMHFYRASASCCWRAILIYLFCLSVRLSVRDTLVLYENGSTYRHSFFHRTVAQSFQFYEHQTPSRNSDGVTPCGGAKYRWGWGIKIARFSTNNSLYLANDTRYRHGCYGRRIGNRIQPIEWHQFQWPWETSKPVFKVTILFNVK